jgi:hypothetical protein
VSGGKQKHASSPEKQKIPNAAATEQYVIKQRASNLHDCAVEDSGTLSLKTLLIFFVYIKKANVAH